jgi:hypothetical protein
MINLLEFSMNHEFKHAWNASARVCYHIIENLSDCMLLYKYKLADPYIFWKFGTSDPDKIDFDKLNGGNIFLFHLDVYKEKTQKIKDIIDWSIESEIDFYIPWSNPKTDHWFQEDDKHRYEIKEILDKYQYNHYDFSDIKYKNDSELQISIIERTKPILRDIKLRNLLD